MANTNQSGTKGIQVFEYPAFPETPGIPGWQAWPLDISESDSGNDEDNKRNGTSNEDQYAGNVDQRLADECSRSFEEGREQGMQEGRQAERESYLAELESIEERRVHQAAELLESFSQARDRYLRDVEREVVKLALAIAARILRREAHMDPLLLTGAVRVALGQLSGSTEVNLHVPASELDLWVAAIALIPNLALKPTVTAGENMRLGDCRIEAVQGSVDLGIRSQLEEIERGFFDGAPRAMPPVSNVSVVAPGEVTE